MRLGWSLLAVLAITSIAVADDPFGEDLWSDQFGSDGVGGVVWDLAVHGNRLVLAGEFYSVGGVRIPNIALWDGAFWHSPGPFALGELPVMAVAYHDGKLFAGGYFGQHQGALLKHIAVLDRDEWRTPGEGLNSYVHDLIVFEDDIIAAGRFTRSGDTEARHVARWDGQAWHPLGTGLNGHVEALAIHDGRLIAGGRFWRADSVDVNNIAAWNGTSWEALGEGFDSSVNALATYDGDLIAGGLFTQSGEIPLNRIARWNGTSWGSLGSGVSGVYDYYTPAVRALAVYNDMLVVGGSFTHGGQVESSCVCLWDGSEWHAMGRGINRRLPFTTGEPDRVLSIPEGVFALQVFDAHVYAGGNFYTAGEHVSRSIAKWGPRDPTPPELLCVPEPNPFRESVLVRYMLREEGNLKLTIHDVVGSRVATLASGYHQARHHVVSWDGKRHDGKRAATGIYYVRLQTDSRLSAKKVLLLR